MINEVHCFVEQPKGFRFNKQNNILGIQTSNYTENETTTTSLLEHHYSVVADKTLQLSSQSGFLRVTTSVFNDNSCIWAVGNAFICIFNKQSLKTTPMTSLTRQSRQLYRISKQLCSIYISYISRGWWQPPESRTDVRGQLIVISYMY